MTPETARPFIDILPPVAEALAAGRPVVALESTIITHGMPYPENSTMAANVEKIIAEEGAVPATIAVMDGRLKIGLSAERTRGARQDFRRDEAVARRPRFRRRRGPDRRHDGGGDDDRRALAGIKVFATGGIGGVHKGAEKSFDISADLDELARTPVIVVSAGAKAILDIEKTLEVLETRGVPVVAFGSDVMPAFWSRQSPYPAPLQARRAGSDRAVLRDAPGARPRAAACWSPTRCRRRTRSRPNDGGLHRGRAEGGDAAGASPARR